MRKIYSLLAASMMLFTTGTTNAQKVSTPLADFSQPAAKLSLSQPGSSRLESIMKAEGSDDVVTDTPAGTLLNVQREAGVYQVQYNRVSASTIYGQATQLVEAEDGSLWLLNPVAATFTDSWVKLDKVGDGEYELRGMNHVYDRKLYDGTVKPYYVTAMKYTTYDDGTTSFEPTEDKVAKFTYTNGTLTYQHTDTYDVIIGLCDKEGTWLGFGDAYSECRVVADAPVTLPTDAQTEVFTMKYNETTTAKVNVAVSGNDLYIANLPGADADLVLKGTIDGDKVTFKDNLYVGISNQYSSHIFLKNAKAEIEENTDGTLVKFLDFTSQDIVMAYDAEARTFSFDDVMVLNVGDTELNYMAAYDQAAFAPYVDFAATPADPEFQQVTPYDEEMLFGMVRFTVYPKGTNGEDLDPNMMYFNLFLDGEKYEFKTDTYFAISENMTDVPCYYTDSYWDFYGDLSTNFQAVATYFADPAEYGIQIIYKGGGEEHRSNIVTYTMPTTDGISSVAASQTGVTYTDMMGHRVTSPAKGLYIKTVTTPSGEKKSVKVLVK